MQAYYIIFPSPFQIFTSEYSEVYDKSNKNALTEVRAFLRLNIPL